jgi:hypothetical protein
MPEGNLETELKIEVAAQDSDLVALYDLEIFGSTSAVSDSRAEIIEDSSDEEVLQLRTDIMRTYDLSEHDMRRVVGRCVAQIAGVQLGKDFFHG